MSRSDWVMQPMLSPDALLKSLLVVWSRYTIEGKQPGAERWIFDDVEYGPQLFADVRAEWQKSVRCSPSLMDDPSCFPYSLTFIRRAFLGIRKFNDLKKRELCKAFGVVFPEPVRGGVEQEGDIHAASGRGLF